MSGPHGYVAFVLHAHFPYLRQAGRWPHGEEALHEALAEAYVPLLATLTDLYEAGLPLRVTLALSPILIEQLSDLVVQKHAVMTLESALERATQDLRRWEATGDGHLTYLARFYVDWYERALNTFNGRFGRNLVTPLRALVDHHAVELFTSSATHYYAQPGCASALLWAQVEAGVASTLRHVGPPVGFWLPELAYRRSMRSHLEELGLPMVILNPQEQATLPQPHWIDAEATVVALQRDRRSLQQVLSSGTGYPGDFLYREFWRRDPTSGLHYWRVTGTGIPMDQKAYYDPYHAMSRAQEHAQHYVAQIEAQLEAARAAEGRPALLVAAFDAELFGHGWFEGSTWLRLVLQQLASHPTLRLTTISSYLHKRPPRGTIESLEPTAAWDGPHMQSHWARIDGAAARMSKAVERYPSAEGERERCLNQAARELLLASSSDWAALIAMGRAPEYAAQRFNQHLARFDQMLELAMLDRLDTTHEALLAEVEEHDNPFPFLNYRMFR